MSMQFWRILLSLALMTASAYCEVALAQPVSHKPQPTFSSSSPVAATTRKAAVSDDRQNFERNLLEYYKSRIVQHLGFKVNEDGAVVRPNGTSTTRPPVSSDIINSNTPINISIDGKRGEPVVMQFIFIASKPVHIQFIRGRDFRFHCSGNRKE